MTDIGEELLAIRNLRVVLNRTDRSIPLIRHVSLDVRKGEIVCLVGESGSGKTVAARTVMGLIQMEPQITVEGKIMFDGADIARDPHASARLRGRDIAMVFQEPLSSLDPVFTVAAQLRESLRRANGTASRSAEGKKMVELLREVGIYDTDRVVRSYPHQLSGGMCQRVMIASALACAPRLLIADEPTTALDVTVQAQVLELIDRLRQENGVSVLLVTHDMGVTADIADRIVVMYAGRVVEDADPEVIFKRAHHPYTRGLLGCIPTIEGDRPKFLPAIGGSVPDPSALPTGCAFHPRCPHAQDNCATDDPRLERIDDGFAACWYPYNTPMAATTSAAGATA